MQLRISGSIGFDVPMKHLLDDLTKNIKAIITSGQDNLDMLNETKASIEKEIKQTRLAWYSRICLSFSVKVATNSII
jgi:hypothetical protein